MFWKFELPLLSRAEIFSKMKRFVEMFENLNCPYHHELNFGKHMADFMKSLENSGCPYYRELKFSQKWSGFVEVIWKFDLALYHKLAFLQKRFDDATGKLNWPCYRGVKFWLNKALFLLWLEYLTFSYIEQKFSQK